MCRQTHSTLVTPTRKFRRNWMHLKKTIMSTILHQQDGNSLGVEWVHGKKTEHPKEVCAQRLKGCSSSRPPRLIQHCIIFSGKQKRKYELFQPLFLLKKTLNPIKAKQKSTCDWTALDDDCHLYQVDSQRLKAIDVVCTTWKSTEKSKLCPAIPITWPQALLKYCGKIKMSFLQILHRKHS